MPETTDLFENIARVYDPLNTFFSMGFHKNWNRITSYNVCYTKLLRIDSLPNEEPEIITPDESRNNFVQHTLYEVIRFLELTSVGIAIGATYSKQITDTNYNLSIWI